MNSSLPSCRKPNINEGCDSAPVFFTRLAKVIDVESKVAAKCMTCSKPLLNNSNKLICCTCSKKLEEIATEVVSKTIANVASSSRISEAVRVADDSDGITKSSGSLKRKSLLPLPVNVAESHEPPKKKYATDYMVQSTYYNNSKKSPDHHLPCLPNARGSEYQQENGFEENPAKKFRTPLAAWSFPNNSDQLSRKIWHLFSENKQTNEVFEKKMTLRDQLHDILLTRFRNCGLYVVGSSMTGLGANSSDMDMCLMLTDSEIDQKIEATNILRIVRSLFSKCNFLFDVELIYAKVPILRFRDSVSGIEVDLNINNAVGIRNTQLLSSYARIDQRLPPLVVLAKLWARFHGINDAKHNTLSSYSLVLMVIHYLQYGCQPPVLPCLQRFQPDKFHPKSNVRGLKPNEDLPPFASENNEDLGNLFVGFLEYFTKHFNFQSSVMSVRLGNIIPKEIAMNNMCPGNKRGHWKFICIEEPFNFTNTARAVFIPEMFHHIKQVFGRSWNSLRKSGDLDSIFN